MAKVGKFNPVILPIVFDDIIIQRSIAAASTISTRLFLLSGNLFSLMLSDKYMPNRFLHCCTPTVAH